MSRTIFALLAICLTTVSACVFDADCSSISYCSTSSKQCILAVTIGKTCPADAYSYSTQTCLNGFCNSSNICSAKIIIGGGCNPASNGQCQNSWCKPTVPGASTGTCAALLDNGEQCTDTTYPSQQCGSGYCNSNTGLCDKDPFVKLGEAAGFALLYIIIIAVAAPIGICVAICICCYCCGRGGRTVVVKGGGQPNVVVAASVPMQPVQQQYYMPQQTSYQPLQYGAPQPQQQLPQYGAPQPQQQYQPTTTYPDITKDNTTNV